MDEAILTYHLRPRDALHLAAMQRSESLGLVRQDPDFDRVPTIHRCTLWPIAHYESASPPPIGGAMLQASTLPTARQAVKTTAFLVLCTEPQVGVQSTR